MKLWTAAIAIAALAFGGSLNATAALADEPTSPVPTLSVSKAAGLDPAGESITVTGTNYSSEFANLHGPGSAGVYVQIGYLDSVWKPSGGAAAGTRSSAYTVWAQGSNDGGTYLKWTDKGDGTADFSWTVAITKAKLDATARDGATLAVFTVGGGGVTQAINEKAVPITFAVPAPTPTLSVSKTSGLDPAGESITVTGTNYSSDFANLHGAGAAGVYAQIGYLDSTWKPSAGAASATRSYAYSVWAQSANDGGAYLKWTDNGDETANFTWTVTITKAALDAKARTGATLAVFTTGGGGVTQAVNEKAVPISFSGLPTSLTLSSPQGASAPAGSDITLIASVTPAVPGDVTFTRDGTDLATVAVDGSGEARFVVRSAPAGSAAFAAHFSPNDTAAYQSSSGQLLFTVAAPPVVVRSGSLSWGVKADFRSYITGPIASGTIITTGVSTNGGAFVFPQSSGSTFDGSTGRGSTGYSGSVRFYGHAGALDVTVKNPVVNITSASSATLSVTTNSGSVVVANLNLAAVTKSTARGAVSYAAVPASLTAQGTSLFAGNYPAGTALDPVSFTIGSAGTASSETKTVAAFVADRTPPATPPATTGVTLAAGIELAEAGEVTISASGFGANEKKIMIVIYSTPVVLAKDLTADADGVVTWTGRLPDGLSGEHTLTVQGSVARGIVLDIPATITTAAVGCPADDPALSWGFKESFRSYISGSIANGSWTVADGAGYETPDFGWKDGSGVYDAETAKGLIRFTGSVRFTGHDGELDTTIANPQIEFVDAKTAYLLLDVSGVTQDGQTVSQKAVRFAELALPAVKAGSATFSFDAVPAVLTTAGSDAFGTYAAGEQLDPVTIGFTSDGSCAVIAPEATSASAPETTPAAADLGWLLWVAMLVVLAAIAATIVIVLRRRRV